MAAMTPIPPEINPLGRYSAAEACALLGISRRTLSRWVEAGKIKVSYSRANMRPRFLGRDLLKLWRQDY